MALGIAAAAIAAFLKSPAGKKILSKAVEKATPVAKTVVKGAKKTKGKRKTKSPTGMDKAQRQKVHYDLAVKHDWDTAIRRKFDKLEKLKLKDAKAVTGSASRAEKAAAKAANRAKHMKAADEGGYSTALTQKRDAGLITASGESTKTASAAGPVKVKKIPTNGRRKNK